VFSRNPATGDAVMQRVYGLNEVTPSALYEMLADGSESVCRWREVLDLHRTVGCTARSDGQPLAMLNLA
jgi:hypothetical protein